MNAKKEKVKPETHRKVAEALLAKFCFYDFHSCSYVCRYCEAESEKSALHIECKPDCVTHEAKRILGR